MFDLRNFGIRLFDDKVMKVKLPSPIYKIWKETMEKSSTLDRHTADAIAHAMKEWALELGCTHYCHWFQPLTGATAKKHDAFIDTRDGEPIYKLSGRSLIKGESDASSFPTGGLRTTFEARGYTYWDCSSPAFVRDNVLYIPTIFVGFNGETLDTKWPLLKSIESISREATRIVNSFGDNDVTSVMPVVGLEQEYFLIDKKDFALREDLFLTGRTLFGAMPPRGQEMHTHYYGVIPSRVKAFMDDVNNELWELGIYAKSEHNEAAPSQFELAPLHGPVNISVDQNQIIMDVLQQTALKHNMVCLLHEKPFYCVNGSGKHNNWSLVTNTGINLFKPTKDPHDMIRFLTFVCAVIKGTDKYASLLRMAASNPGNDFRLGGNEAPPAVVSIFLGQTLEELLYQFIKHKPVTYTKSSLNEFGVQSLSYLPHETADRNRTSPIAFTGNKFEFRMLGSSMNAAFLNTVINIAVADALKEIADQLENHKYRQDKREAAMDICLKIMNDHSRILYNGDGYSTSWLEEATKRGLPNYKTFIDSINSLNDINVRNLFKDNFIFNDIELDSRINVAYYEYYNIRSVEYKTLIHLTRSLFIPTLLKEIKTISEIFEFAPPSQKEKVKKINEDIELLSKYIDQLEEILIKATEYKLIKDKAIYLSTNTHLLANEIISIYNRNESCLSISSIDYPTLSKLFFGLDY